MPASPYGLRRSLARRSETGAPLVHHRPVPTAVSPALRPWRINDPAPRQHLDALQKPRFGVGVFRQKRPGLCFVLGLDDQHAADHPLAIGGQERPADLDAIAMSFQELEMGGTVGEPRLKPVRAIPTKGNKVHRWSPRALVRARACPRVVGSARGSGAFASSREPWFVAADACRALGHSNPTVAVRLLADNERAVLDNEPRVL